jgi:hypothetical protein
VENETYKVCPSCREVVDPTDHTATYGVELVRADTFRGTDWLEGLGGFFHAGCSPEAIDWRTKPRPT